MANTLKFGAGKWATSNGTALAYNDENNNFKPLSIHFTRASKATVVNQSGLIEEVSANDPRIDFLGNTKGSILLEPQRTNSVTYSEDFSHSNYYKTNSTVTSGFLAPDGTNNATKLVTSAVNAQILFSAGSGNTNTKAVSVFAKANTSTSKFKIIEQYYSGHQTLFDLNLGVVEFNNSAGSKIEDYGNGWYKCTHIQSYTSGQNNSTFAFRTNTAESLFIWGAQLEVGAYPTSYIPTSGSAVTRVVDFSSSSDKLPIDISIGANEDFSIYYECSLLSVAGNNNMLLGGGVAGSDITSKSYLWVIGSTTIRITGTEEVVMATGLTTFEANTNYKILLKRNGNVIDFFVNGVKLNTTQGTPNTSFTIRSLGWSYNNGVYKTSGKIKGITTYNTALTDAQAIALTTN